MNGFQYFHEQSAMRWYREMIVKFKDFWIMGMAFSAGFMVHAQAPQQPDNAVILRDNVAMEASPIKVPLGE